jgi:tRNA(fMet)-specific endonuclease VapC
VSPCPARAQALRGLSKLPWVAGDCQVWRVWRASPSVVERVNACLRERTIAISAITLAELRFGQLGQSLQDRRRPLIDSFLLRLPCMEWGMEAADHYVAQKYALKPQSTPIAEMDTQIAAHVLAENLVPVTHNPRHFERIAGLALDDWMV